jgi:hypothetical protein
MSESENDVTPESSSGAEAQAGAPQTEAVKPKGSQTPETQLYAALRETRQKVKALEGELTALRSQRQEAPAFDGEHSEEGKILKAEIDSLKEKLTGYEQRSQMAEVLASNPLLRGEETAFAAFAEEYPGVPLSKLARLYLAERGVPEAGAPKPTGLERPSGGGEKPADPRAMTGEEIQNLRENHPRKYAEMLRKGKIDPDSIK